MISQHKKRHDRLVAPPASRPLYDYMMPARRELWAMDEAVRTIVAWAKELAGGPRDWRAHAAEVPRLRPESPETLPPRPRPLLPWEELRPEARPRVRFSPAFGGMAIDTETGGLADSAAALMGLLGKS